MAYPYATHPLTILCTLNAKVPWKEKVCCVLVVFGPFWHILGSHQYSIVTYAELSTPVTVL